MSSAEITSIATLCSVIISSAIMIWRTIVNGNTVNDVQTKTNNIQNATAVVSDKTDTIAKQVNGNMDQLVNTVSQIHDNLINQPPH